MPIVSAISPFLYFYFPACLPPCLYLPPSISRLILFSPRMLSADSPVNKWKPAIRITILLLICSVATLVRVFSVIRYESIIHEFDPWFNFRATKFLVNNNFKEFWNFFDSESWYPLGRNVGATVYPGLMVPPAPYSPPADSSTSYSTNWPSPSTSATSASSWRPSSPVSPLLPPTC